MKCFFRVKPFFAVDIELLEHSSKNANYCTQFTVCFLESEFDEENASKNACKYIFKTTGILTTEDRRPAECL